MLSAKKRDEKISLLMRKIIRRKASWRKSKLPFQFGFVSFCASLLFTKAKHNVIRGQISLLLGQQVDNEHPLWTKCSFHCFLVQTSSSWCSSWESAHANIFKMSPLVAPLRLLSTSASSFIRSVIFNESSVVTKILMCAHALVCGCCDSMRGSLVEDVCLRLDFEGIL